ncbi:uncharacterized protein PAC_05268 [Phialocephala subalpina]|uniref:Uncharacterized protein n=1 Tax=Phialocephala subalpina TaxID=576137 RepID=A0A1L7WRJ0_9HELO|nr:uncharacterized protein PAC_05268 [Phialocephala subalpina]
MTKVNTSATSRAANLGGSPSKSAMCPRPVMQPTSDHIDPNPKQTSSTMMHISYDPVISLSISMLLPLLLPDEYPKSIYAIRRRESTFGRAIRRAKLRVKKLESLLFKPTPSQALIEIGDGASQIKRTVGIYEAIHHSDYFMNALKAGWDNSRTRLLHLEDSHEQSWALFEKLIRQGHFSADDIIVIETAPLSSIETSLLPSSFSFGMEMGNKEGIQHGRGDIAIVRLIQAYLLGQHLEAPAFCNEIMYFFIPRYRHFITTNN